MIVAARIEESAYFEAIEILNACGGIINESIFSNISSAVKSKIEFIQSFAKALKKNVSDVLVFFKNKKVFQFFSAIKFNMKLLFKKLKNGYDAYKKLLDAIAEYIANTGIVKWTAGEIKKLDKFLKAHPVIKKIAGPAVAGILLYIWLNMAFTGDFEFDFDFTDMIAALQGSFSLTDLFTGAQGIKMLTLFFVGIAGTSFPWPGPQSYQLVLGVTTSLIKMIKDRSLNKLSEGIVQTPTSFRAYLEYNIT